MHSSTSSFKPLPRVWYSLLLAVALSATCLAAYEVFWRSRGFAPTLTNNESLWCEARARATGDAIAIVGSSRLQRGLDPELLSRAFGGRAAVQLALDGGHVAPVLADLARDSSFHGVVILEYMPGRWFLADSPGVGRTQAFVASCANPSLVAGVEARLDRVLQRKFVFLSPELSAITVLSFVAHAKALPKVGRDVLRDDRFLEEHYRGETVPFEAPVWASPLSPPDLDARLAAMRGDAGAIRARGGCVVIYRPPVEGPTLDDEEAHYPARLWFPKVSRALGVPAIDFAAVPALRGLGLPDGSHPDVGQVPAITNAVAEQLRLAIASCQTSSL